jgi:hypothetical protein
MNPFRSLPDYEEFIYTLPQHFQVIKSSSLTVIRRGRCTALLQGELVFAHGYRLVIRERLTSDYEAVRIESYGYEFWHNADRISWYDSQPHPNDTSLAGTHPHHKHIPPDIKHHRVPAPNISFTSPNIPVLIQEVEGLLDNSSSR